jgi:hypothetical protein
LTEELVCRTQRNDEQRIYTLEKLFTAVVITHPSFGPADRRHRKYGPLKGPDAEDALLRDALQAAGSTFTDEHGL